MRTRALTRHDYLVKDLGEQSKDCGIRSDGLLASIDRSARYCRVFCASRQLSVHECKFHRQLCGDKIRNCGRLCFRSKAVGLTDDLRLPDSYRTLRSVF